MGVSSRSGIVTKILEVLLSGSNLERTPSMAGDKLLDA
jgi:hypothetical protein